MSEPNWQPIETAPKDGTWILATWGNYDGYPCLSSVHWREGGWYDHPEAEEETDLLTPTHWMPLPVQP